MFPKKVRINSCRNLTENNANLKSNSKYESNIVGVWNVWKKRILSRGTKIMGMSSTWNWRKVMTGSTRNLEMWTCNIIYINIDMIYNDIGKKLKLKTTTNSESGNRMWWACADDIFVQFCSLQMMTDWKWLLYLEYSISLIRLLSYYFKLRKELTGWLW